MNNRSPWNEAHLSENPAVAQLQRLGWNHVPAEVLDAERASQREVILTARLEAALKKLNPWLSEDNLKKAVRTVTQVQSTGLLEASEKLYTWLTYGIALEQDKGDGQGKKNHTVHFIDFAEPQNNDSIVTRQLKFQGVKANRIPDVLLYVNGLPMGIIECKSPTIGDGWKHEAIAQLAQYQELEPNHRDLGVPKLFETMQVLVVTCGQAAAYGTVHSSHKFYLEWKTTYPKAEKALEAELGRAPNPQELLLEGMFAPANFLDLVRNFVVFEKDTGRTVRKLCRYQQFAAVNKAVARARLGKTPIDRGGVVWHTQGSGKSLTMLWLALKLRRDAAQKNPTLVLVTDRKDLDDQIAKTFVACGFPNPDRAESVRHLRELLSGPAGKTILTTVQKFQAVEGSKVGPGKRPSSAPFPLMSEASNLFVLADEAHRTQYGGLAANLRAALPNACFFAFSGTPIDKKDRSTQSTFGSYIDTYTIQQAVADGATLPIFYEGRLADVKVSTAKLDDIFGREFSDRTEEEQEAIKAKYAKEAAIASAPKRIESICLDIIEHYTQHIQPNGFKAQVVAVSREAAVLYKETLDRLHAPPSAIIMSGSNKDGDRLARHHSDEDTRKQLIERFKDKNDPLSILVVCDMLLTGFDAPVEQVMYLDAPLREHTLLQAIARVNRTYNDHKKYGLVVDYWGVSENLQEALAMFAPSDVKGAMTPKSDELPRLQTRHAAAMRIFVNVKQKDDLEQCVGALASEDVRAEFDEAFKRFAESVDMMLPDKQALPYQSDLKWLGKIRASAAARYRDGKLDISDCGAKVRALIEQAITADGIQILVKQVSLFSAEFDKRMAELKTEEARASEMEHAIKNEIHVKLDEDPAYFSSLKQRLEQLIEDRKAKRIDAAQQLKLFEALRTELRTRDQVAENAGMSVTSFALYGLLSERTAMPYGAVDEVKKELAGLLEDELEKHVQLVDWSHKEEVLRDMRKFIKRQLKVASVPDESREAMTESIVEYLKRTRGS